MYGKEELLPPPPKKTQSVDTNEELLPPPPKKKDTTALSTGGEQPSPTQSSSKPQSLFGKFPTSDEYYGNRQGFNTDVNFSSRKKRIKSINDYLPAINSMRQPAVKDETYLPKPITEVDIQEKEKSAERHKQNLQQALDNTTENYFKLKGVTAPKGSALYNEQRAKYEKMLANKDATYHMGKDGKPGLDRTVGWWEGITNGWNEAMYAEDEAAAFAEMNTQERVAFANKKMEEKPPTEFVGEQYGLAGSAGHLLSSSSPFLLKAAGGATLGAMTGGTGAPLIMSIAATAPDMINEGMKNEVMDRYMQLKRENPNTPDEELMSIAEKGELSGGIQGAVQDLMFIGTGLKAPLTAEGKYVLGKNLSKTLTGAAHVGLVTGGVAGAGMAEKKLEGYNVTTGDIADKSINTALDNFNGMLLLNGIIHGVTGVVNIPKNVMSAFKYAVKDIPTPDIQAALRSSEILGKIPEGTTERVVKDIEQYKNELAKTSPTLTPESQASVAGLMQARDNVEADMMTKDPTQRQPYVDKINSYNEQIKKITETNEPFKYEIDEVTGKPLDQKTKNAGDKSETTTTEVTEPLQQDEPTTQEQGTETTIPESTKTTGQGNAETTTTVLTKEAEDLLASVGEGSMPTFITKNLEKIAADNGVVITDKMTAVDVINALKEKQISNEAKANTTVSDVSGKVDETHLKVSSDAKTALADGRKKQEVVADENGNPIVKETEFTKDDADLELDRLEALAKKGKLTPEEFQKSYFGQSTDTTTFKAASEQIKNDAVGFVEKLRNSFEGEAEPQPTNEAKANEVQQSTEVEKPTITEPNKVGEEAETATEEQVKKLITDAAINKKGERAKQLAMEEEAAKHGELGQKVLDDMNGGKEPPIETKEVTNDGSEDWASVRKEKLKEISGVKEMMEKRKPKGWTQTFQSAAENVQKMFPKKSLYEAMKARVKQLKLKLESGELYNPTSEDNAVFTMFRAETNKRILEVEGQDSSNPVERLAANIELENLHNDLMDIARVTNPEGEAGRAFNILQSEAKFDENNGLKIRRMELMKAKGGEPLTPEENKWAESQWEKEKEIMRQEQEAKVKGMQEDFDAKIDELQKEYEDKLKETGKGKSATTKDKTLSQKGKDIADQIRKLKIQKGDTAVDVTMGLRNLAIEAVATLVEKGATIAEAIKKVLEDDKYKGLTGDELTNHIIDGLKNKKDKAEELSKIEKFAEENDVTDITNDMVKDNLIRDYVNSHIGEVDKKEVFDAAFKDLKEILPNITKERLRDAYLKEGEFKQPTKKALEGGIKQQETELRRIAREERTADQQQKIKLADEKENVIKKKKEYERKLADNEFQEPEPIKLKKKDAELIRLEKEKSIIEEAYRKKQKEFQEKNKHWAERAMDTIRSSYVALLIGSPVTLAKVGFMSLVRPLSEGIRKATLGKVFDSFFPNISKAALRGGESSSISSIKKGYEAYFRNIGEAKLEEKYQKAESELRSAAKEYNDYKNSSNPDAKKLEQLKNKMNDKLIKSTGSFIYKFIGSSSIKDAWTALVNRSNEIEKQFGKVESESFKDGNWLDKSNYIAGFIGRSHSAAKTFSGRFSFAAGFMARLEGAVKNGEDITSGNKILEIAHESYLDWERGKYQQTNAISDIWNKIVNSIAKGEEKGIRTTTAKAMESLLKGDVAITRVPVNILHESVVEYTFGAIKAAYMGGKEYLKARRDVKESGIMPNEAEFKDALRQRISQMDEKQAATIVRCFTKGGLGIGLYALALISGGVQFGILPHLGQKKKKDEKDLKKGEMNPGDIIIGDTRMNHTFAKLVEHVPALYPTAMGLGMAQAYKDEIDKGKTTKEAVAKSLFTHLQIIEGSIPQTQILSPSRVSKKMYDIGEKRLEEIGVVSADEKSIFTKGEQENATIKTLKERGIELKQPSQSHHKIDVDEKHPNGLMMPDEWDKFQKIRKDVILKGIPKSKDHDAIEGLDDIMKAHYKVVEKRKWGRVKSKIVQGKDLTDEQLKSKVQSLQEKATEYANDKLGLKKKKDTTTTIKKIR